MITFDGVAVPYHRTGQIYSVGRATNDIATIVIMVNCATHDFVASRE